ANEQVLVLLEGVCRPVGDAGGPREEGEEEDGVAVGMESDFVLCSWFLRAVFETKNKVSCIGLVYTAPVHPSLKAVSLSTAGPEKVSSDGPLGDSCIGLVYTAPVHPSLKAVSLSTAGPEKVSSDGPLGDSCIGLVYTAPVHPSLKAV